MKWIPSGRHHSKTARATSRRAATPPRRHTSTPPRPPMGEAAPRPGVEELRAQVAGQERLAAKQEARIKRLEALLGRQ
jgi:hypothetical protein